MDVFREFAPSPAVQEWIREASDEARDALVAVLVVIKERPFPGGSLLQIRPFREPVDIPTGFTVPFYEGRCLLLYEVPLRVEEPIRLVLILDPYFFSAEAYPAS